jgi:hypothetical protein
MTDDRECCPGCDTPIDDAHVRDHGDIQHFSCLACGLQLVRRPGDRWESIRG